MTVTASPDGALVLDGDDVRALLPVRSCIDVMAEALSALARGEAEVPLRSLLWLPDRSGLLGMMPGWYGPAGVMGIKTVSVMPGNHGTPFDAHQGAVLLFETKHGRPLAIVDASAITAIRTAAVSGVATRLLARENASVLAILGSGIQATTHLDAMLAVRPIERVRVWSRTPANAHAFARRAAQRYSVETRAADSARRAVQDAHIICTTTSSREPVLLGDWITPGTHINAVGSSVRSARELDAAAVAKARMFVDRKESTLNESGDFLLAKAEGAVNDSHIVAELGDVLTGFAEGRTGEDEITLFESLGLAVEDIAAAHAVWREAAGQGRGVRVALGGVRP